jgi:putative PIN family toxin of toxin-antitoxin system
MKSPLIIVPDVNVMISGIHLSKYAPSQVMQAWRRKELELVTSDAILKELARVLAYPRVIRITQFTPEQAQQYVANMRRKARLVSGVTSVKVSIDPTDDKLFTAALEAKADFIVSMDVHHVLNVGTFRGIRIIHPTDFVNTVLQKQSVM